MATVNSCPMCGASVSQDARSCPQCGDKFGGRAGPTRPHSGPGIASLAFAIPGAITAFSGFGVIAYLVFKHRGESVPFQSMVVASLVFWGGFGLLVIAAVLGLVGVLLPDRNKRYAILGLVISLLPIVIFVGVLAIGLMAATLG